MDSNTERKKFLETLNAKDIIEQKTNNPKTTTGSDHTIRSDIKLGAKVLIIQKHHQRTGETTEGIVKDILTNSKNHHRGIKVRLESGIVGRVQNILL